MAKKDLSSLVNGIIGTDNPQPTSENQVKPVTNVTKESKKDSDNGTVVTSIRVKRKLLKQLKIIAATEECSLQHVIFSAFSQYIDNWNRENK